MSDGDETDFAADALGFLVAGVGVVAAGVRLGMEWTDFDRAKREH